MARRGRAGSAAASDAADIAIVPMSDRRRIRKTP
jgi:hypothetical protein